MPRSGLTEAKAREKHEVVVAAIVHFDSTTRTIIDGRKVGFCKLVVDRMTYRMLGCHVVGERAVEITQVAAIAIAAKMRVDEFGAHSAVIPTYAGILAAWRPARQRELNLKVDWQAHQAESDLAWPSSNGTDRDKGKVMSTLITGAHLQPKSHRAKIHGGQTTP